MSCTKMTEPIVMPFGMLTPVGPRNHVLDGVQIHHVKGQFWRQKGAGSGHAQVCPEVDILKATQQRATSVQCGCQMWCTRGAHCRNLVNTSEPSVCHGQAAALSNYFNHLLTW